MKAFSSFPLLCPPHNILSHSISQSEGVGHSVLETKALNPGFREDILAD